MIQSLRFIFALLVATAQFYAPNANALHADRLSSLITQTLEEKYSRSESPAEIEVPSLEKVAATPQIQRFATIHSVRLVEDKSTGVALFEVRGVNDDHQAIVQVIQTPFKAWVKAPIAAHRIFPNTQLKKADFKIQPVNVATGMGREYRGLIAGPNVEIDKMQSHQTILEGQFLVTSAMQKQADLKKGETIRLELSAGDLTLTTQAVTQEAASIGDRIHVLTVKTKREIVGKVRPDHSVEVVL